MCRFAAEARRIQGTTIPPIARLLRVNVPTASDFSPAEVHLAGRGESALVTLNVAPGSTAANHRVVELNWPRETLILVVYRGNDFFVPNGATELKPNDRLIVLTSKETVEQVQASVAARRSPTACCS
jgi:potassium/hydrogen antiporter